MESLDEIFEKLPVKWGKKPILAVMRKGANVVRKQMKQNFPGEIAPLNKVVLVKANRGISLSVGVFAKIGKVMLKDGRDYDPYFPIYWFNYGTYAERDGGHKFKFPRKSKTSHRSGGIRAGRFMEKSWEETRSQVVAKMENELKDETMKFLRKYAV